MITPNEAAEKVKSTQKYKQVLKVRDYDLQHYVVDALPEANKLPEVGIQTTFGVDKQTGEVTAFYLTPENLEKYRSAKQFKF